MSGIANCTISGALARDPDLRMTPSGNYVCNLSIPVYGGKDADGEYLTTWWNISLWKEEAEKAASKFRKGTIVSVTGTNPHPNHYESNGEQKWSMTMDWCRVVSLSKTTVEAPEDTEEVPAF